MQHYILYKTVNTKTHQYYIGVHQTTNLDDRYLGSGKRLRNNIKKHGRENFERIVLEKFDNADSMFAREAEIVTDVFCSQVDVLNLVPGGTGGSILKNRKAFSGPHNDATKKLLAEQSANRIHSTETKKKISDNNFSKRQPEKHREHMKLAGKLGAEARLVDGKLPDEIKQKIRESALKYGKHKKVKCVYCQKEVGVRSVNRWHNENCKFKPTKC